MEYSNQDIDGSLSDIACRIDFDWTQKLKALLILEKYSDESKKTVAEDIHGHGFLLRSEAIALEDYFG